MKPKFLIGIALVSTIGVQSVEWKPDRKFLSAVREVESSGGKMKIGDNGESLGEFQMSEGAWLDVSEWRRARGLKTYEYDSAVFNSFVTRVYASNYLTILHGELRRKLNRPPTEGELYAAYNMGMGMFAQCDFKLHRVNAVTRAKARQISQMLGNKRG